MKFSNEVINEWCKLYKITSAKEISEKYDVSINTVLKYLRLNNIKIRSKAALKVANKKKYNENFFEKIDNEYKAYYLGLLFADGNISRVKYQNRVSISLKEEDLNILEKFKKTLEGEMNICHSKGNSILFFSGKKIVNDLKKYGMIPNKSLKLKFPNINKDLFRHFIRGYFDGDGNIYFRKDSKGVQFTLYSGTKEFLIKINNIFQEIVGLKKSNIYDFKNSKCHSMSWYGKESVKKIYDFLYKKSDIFLDRKKNSFDKINTYF